jgi:tRNA 2-thiouridine synthesizing protein A
MADIDVRGLSCPLPVVKTKKAMEADPKAVLSVLLDAEVSTENVTRLAESQGYAVKAEAADAGEFRLTLTPGK